MFPNNLNNSFKTKKIVGTERFRYKQVLVNVFNVMVRK